MSQDPNNRRGGEYDEAVLLLPWYVTGTLDDAEKALVERQLEQHQDLREEIALLRDVKSAVAAPDETHPSPSPQRLDALMRRIDRHEAGKWAEHRIPRDSIWQWLQRLMVPGPWPVALMPALAGLVILVQAVALVAILMPAPTGQDGFVTAAGPAESAEASYQRIIIAFHGGAVESDIRAALVAVDAAIVDGPTADGIYTLEIRRTLESRADLDRVVETLLARRAIVRFAAAAAP